MRFTETKLKGAFVIEREPSIDFRGNFARVFCADELKKQGLNFQMVQSNISFTAKKETIRGMHYQVEGGEEDKIVTCLKGRILDVIIDLRRDSETFSRYLMFELFESDNKMLYVPRGFAHGFLTLEDNCQVLYFVSNFYNPTQERRIRWNDPFFNIKWPIENPIISEKDASCQDFKA